MNFTIITYKTGIPVDAWEAQSAKVAIDIHDKAIADLAIKNKYPAGRIYDVVVFLNDDNHEVQIQRTEVDVWLSQTADDIDEGTYGQRNYALRDLTELDIRSPAFTSRTSTKGDQA